MKNIINSNRNYRHSGLKCAAAMLLGCVIAMILPGCSKVLDKTDLNAFNENQVFNDSLLARGYVDYIYDQNSPGWPSGDWLKVTDEIAGETPYFDGSVQVGKVADYGTSTDANTVWGKFRTINQFIEKMDKSTLSPAYKARLAAQVKFFRAYRYFELIKLYGGVPILLNVQDGIGQAAKDASELPRNKTSECIAQIVKDLDDAIAGLPGKWDDGDDWGRITSGAAAALKGRVLLYWASPQFNPNDLQDRWKAAYDANKQAMDLLTANGYGLNPDFQNMWFKEVDNPEAVWSVGYNNQTADQLKKNDGWDNSTRPAYLGTGGGSNQPVWQIVNAFPMKDGKKIDDPTGEFAYNPQLFYKNRDPRFDATIAYNGCTWSINGNEKYRLWTYFVGSKSAEPKSSSSTGFYCRKAIDPKVGISDVQFVGTDWMEIRFAEVVLNLAESAIGINKLPEGYEGIEQIRERAGIEAGSDGLYGLKSGMDRTELFKAVLYERQIEFAFEGKRYWDMRRWKLFESTLNGTSRTGVKISLNTSLISGPDMEAQRDTMDLDELYTKYFTFQNQDLDTKFLINWQSNYYFFPLPQQAIDNDPLLLQTKGWNDGTFDPLQ